MSFLRGITKVALSPLRGVSQLVEDVEDLDPLAIATLGVSSVVKGTAKGVKDGSEDIFDL